MSYSQVGNLGLLFFLLFFIFAALGVELFGRLGEITFFLNLIKNETKKFQECGHTDNFHRYFREGFLTKLTVQKKFEMLLQKLNQIFLKLKLLLNEVLMAL